MFFLAHGGTRQPVPNSQAAAQSFGHLPFSPCPRPYIPIPLGALVHPTYIPVFRSLPCPHSLSATTSWNVGITGDLCWSWEQAQEGNSWLTSTQSIMRGGTDLIWAHPFDPKESSPGGKQGL